MSIKIKVARTPAEIDGVFKARYRVFSEEEDKFPHSADKRVYDHFDALPTSSNIAAILGDQVVGGMRITEASAAGMPSDHYFDFRPFLPDGEPRIASASLFCLQKEYRSLRKIAFMILCMSCYWAIQRGIRYVVAPINPDIAPMIKLVGFKPVSDVISHPASGLDILPMMLNMDEIRDQFLTYATRQKMGDWLESFDREFFKAGERVTIEGDEATCAYIIVDGTLNVSIGEAGSENEKSINEMTRGELFGELALMMDTARTANVTAVTDCDLMVIDKKTFQSKILADPQHAQTVLSLLGKRLANTTTLLHR